MATVYFRLGNPVRGQVPGISQVPAGNYYIENMPGMNTAGNVCTVIDEPNLTPIVNRIQKIWMQYDGGTKTVVNMHTGKQLITKEELSDFAQAKLTSEEYKETKLDFPFGSARFLRHGH
jgi:hypothetical protein